MTAPQDPTCLCGDPKSAHRLGRKGCKALDCGCGEFEAADDAAEKERVNRALIPVLEDNAERMRAELGEQSTSARLRAVEAERDVALAQRDANMRAHARAAAELIGQRDGAAERWAEARDEIERLRAQLTYLAEGRRPAVEIYGWDAEQCLTCGSRYRNGDPDHPHPLTAVRVSITERQEHHP